MDKQMDIVFWAFPSWSGNYLKSTVELAKELALRHRVLYIDYAFTIKDLLSRRAAVEMLKAYILGKDSGLRKVALQNSAVINVLSLPAVLPLNWIGNEKIYSMAERLNTSLIRPRVMRAVDTLKFDTSIVVNAFNPFMAAATESIFTDIPIIYYCYDNIAASQWASKHGGRLEAMLAKKADAAIFSSEALKRNKNFAVPAYVVTNGVDLRNYLQNGLRSKKGERKTIGYVGTIDDRLDYHLLTEIIMARPQYDFKFVGRATSGHWKQIASLPNVTFTGAVDAARLPEILAEFSAGIIPFVKNDFTKNIYPMKVNEYLVMGLPVVATDFAIFDDLSACMVQAHDPEEFLEALDKEISGDNAQKSSYRKSFAIQNSWEQKAADFEQILKMYAV